MYDLIAQLFVCIFAVVYAAILVGLIILWVRKGVRSSKQTKARLPMTPQNADSASAVLESLDQDRK